MTWSLKPPHQKSYKKCDALQEASKKASLAKQKPLGEATNQQLSDQKTKKLEEDLKKHKDNVKEYKWRWHNVRWRGNQKQKADEAQKINLKQAKAEVAHLWGTLEITQKWMSELEKENSEVSRDLHEWIATLKMILTETTHQKHVLSKQNHWLMAAKQKLKKTMQDTLKNQPNKFHMMKKGTYAPTICSIACLLVSSGTTEAKVGDTLQKIGKEIGIEMLHCLSRHSVEHFTIELGVGADLQAVYKIVKAGHKQYSQND